MKKRSKKHHTKHGGKVAQISRKAKKIRKPGEKWIHAIKRASKLV